MRVPWSYADPEVMAIQMVMSQGGVMDHIGLQIAHERIADWQLAAGRYNTAACATLSETRAGGGASDAGPSSSSGQVFGPTREAVSAAVAHGWRRASRSLRPGRARAAQ
jgi:hypothetical protein